MTKVARARGRGEEAMPAGGGDGEAMARAGRLLTTRARTERELSDRLAAAGFEPGVVARVVERLRELHVLDDLDFARSWIAERGGRRGRAALLAELEGKGVAREIAEGALDERGPDETEAATELAGRQLRRVAHLPLQAQGARLYRFLAGRGFSDEVAEQAVRAVLPPEGWD